MPFYKQGEMRAGRNKCNPNTGAENGFSAPSSIRDTGVHVSNTGTLISYASDRQSGADSDQACSSSTKYGKLRKTR